MEIFKLIISIFAAIFCLVNMYYFHEAHKDWDTKEMIYYWIEMLFFFIMLTK